MTVRHKLKVYVEIDTRKSKPLRPYPCSIAGKRLRAKMTPVRELRCELGLKQQEFNKLSYDVRQLARDHLDLTLPHEDQDPAIWKSFVHAVCDAHPYFKQFEDCWPLEIYVSKYLRKYLQRANTHRRALRNARFQVPAVDTGRNLKSVKMSLNIQINLEAIARPNVDNEIHLVDVNSQSEELQAAMGLVDGQLYNALIDYMHSLSVKHLYPDKLFCEQDEWDWRAFVREICIEYPFIKQYEDHWPVEFHMKKYLECRFDALTQESIAACRARPQPAAREPQHPKQPHAGNVRSRAARAPASSSLPSLQTPRVLRSRSRLTSDKGARQIRSCEEDERVPALKAQGDMLKKFRDDGKITELQYSMLFDGLHKALLPFVSI